MSRIAPTHRTRHRTRTRGQSLVEFAVVLPVFLLVLAGIVDFGLGLYSQMTVINAAREGARLGVVEAGAVNGNSTAAIDKAISDRVTAMAGGLDSAQLKILPSCQKAAGGIVDCATALSGDSVVVEVDYNYAMIWPLALGNHLGLSSKVTMRIE